MVRINIELCQHRNLYRLNNKDLYFLQERRRMFAASESMVLRLGQLIRFPASPTVPSKVHPFDEELVIHLQTYMV